jgi:hypothetical protein
VCEWGPWNKVTVIKKSLTTKADYREKGGACIDLWCVQIGRKKSLTTKADYREKGVRVSTCGVSRLVGRRVLLQKLVIKGGACIDLQCVQIGRKKSLSTKADYKRGCVYRPAVCPDWSADNEWRG